MKQIFLGILMFLMVTYGNLYAQDIRFGLRGGLNLPSIMSGGTNTPASEGYKSRMAAGVGIFTEVQFTELFSVRLGVEYSGLGGKKDGMQAMPTQRLITETASSMGMSMTDEHIAALGQMAQAMPQYYYADVKNTTKFDYVMIPVLAQCGWNLGSSPWRVYVNAGPFVSFLVSGKQVLKGKSRIYADNAGQATLWSVLPGTAQQAVTDMFPAMSDQLQNPVDLGEANITGEMKSTNFGITGNVGIRYQCGANHFFIEAGGNYGFIAVQSSSDNGSNRLGAGSVMLGYAFSLF